MTATLRINLEISTSYLRGLFPWSNLFDLKPVTIFALNYKHCRIEVKFLTNQSREGKNNYGNTALRE
jgi:hypothetical protein